MNRDQIIEILAPHRPPLTWADMENIVDKILAIQAKEREPSPKPKPKYRPRKSKSRK